MEEWLVMYTGIVLDRSSRQKLVRRFAHIIPASWDIVAHHMTINMGPIFKGPADENLLGKEVELTVNSVAADEKVFAVGVTTDVPSKNDKKHITIAVNREQGGKPVMSNQLEHWEPLSEPLDLYGTVTEVR